jgi:HAD superfamily phosphoserine phosphatase-like hydrolase
MSIAFFDIDGTLLAEPSLEWRFFWNLRRQGEIPAKNYLAWLAESVRLGRRGIKTATHANKMYLRGLTPESLHQHFEHSHWLPQFFPAALQRIWWHTMHGDTIVLVSGTLSPLAELVRFALEGELLWRSVELTVSVIATQLEVSGGRWTGRVSGSPMFAESKAGAIREFANAQQASLSCCSAYGDSSLDRWMLASVGHRFAVNATRRMCTVARLQGWPMLRWTHCPLRTAGEQRDARSSFRRNLKRAL